MPKQSIQLEIGILLSSMLIFAITFEPLVVACGVVGAMVVSLLRREDGLLIGLFCLGYQLLFVVAGIVFRGFSGEYPSDHIPKNIELSVALLLATFLSLAIGLRSGLALIGSQARWRSKWTLQGTCDYSIDKLFWITILAFSISLITGYTPREISSGFSQIIYRVLEFRLVFIYLLFVMVLRQRRGRVFAIIAALVVTLPMIKTGGSGFAQVLILLFVAMLSESNSIRTNYLFQDRSRVVIAAILAVSLLAIALLWNGAVKAPWRSIVTNGRLAKTTVGQVEQFADTAIDSVEHMDWREGIKSAVKRISDVPLLMGLVLDRVPRLVDYEGGYLTMRAVKHVVMPRFLFPDKANLGSDSDLVEKYTGLYVAGIESNTSIGLGYMVEFYVDYGPVGMVFAGFAFGFIIGCMYRGIFLFAPSREIYQGVLVAIMLQHFMSLDGSLAKIVGGLVMAFVIQSMLLMIFGDRMHRYLLMRPGSTVRMN